MVRETYSELKAAARQLNETELNKLSHSELAYVAQMLGAGGRGTKAELVLAIKRIQPRSL